MINDGYYLKARSIKDSWVQHSPPVVRELWDYLLREATHSKQKYKGYTLNRGQLFRSYRDIQQDLHWYIGYRKQVYHVSSLKRATKALMNERMIELTSEPRGILVTVCNYDFYQNPKNYDRTNERTDESTDAVQRPNARRSPINKNEKNDKNVKNVKNIKGAKNAPIPTFEEFRKYCKENKPTVAEQEIVLKYKSWTLNGWRDGNNKPVINWKVKLLHTLPHMKNERKNPPGDNFYNNLKKI